MKEKFRVLPPGKIGIVGGGQLGRMLAIEGKRMGYKIVVLDENPVSPAAQVSDEVIVGSVLDPQKIRELAMKTDVLTYEFEFINTDVLCDLEREGFRVYPSGTTLKKIQNKYNQKTLFKEQGLPVPKLKKVVTWNDVEESTQELGFPIILKNCVGGYDGKGNYVIRNREELTELKSKLKITESEFMVEECIDFEKEISIVIARGINGQVACFPVVENIHKNSILKITKAPSKIDDKTEKEIKRISNKILEIFNDVGVFCIELFLKSDGTLYINEIAPRPHNSGHYTIEACITSQFEQQLRAITGLPLGSTKMIAPSVMVNLLGDKAIHGEYRVQGLENVLDKEGVYFHFYGKKFVDIEKKIGHITVVDENFETAMEKATSALNSIEIVEGI